ncbi:MAG: N-methyl-L-tryptophan oxidase [bacterium]
MSEGNYEVIVVGGGVMGSATAWHLARDGKRTLLLEQFEIAHNHGSSHGESRIFRVAYPKVWYTRLALQAKEHWRELEREAGEPLLRVTGGMDFADDEAGYADVNAVATSLASTRRPYESYDWARLARRYPQWRMMEGVVAVYSPESGALNPTRCVQVLAARAAAHGCEIHEQERVTQIIPRPDGVELTTDKGKYSAARLVLTAGAWAKELLSQIGLNLPLKVTQEQTVHFRPRANAESFAPGKFPVWIHYRKEAVYGFPVLGEQGVKVAFHKDGPTIDIEEYRQEPRACVRDRLRAYLERYLPDAAGEAFGELTCLYTNTPDEGFILDVAPGNPQIVVGSPCSGHGFKFAAGIGRALADLATKGTTDMEVGHLGIARFVKAG